jgi:hypothetical protein
LGERCQGIVDNDDRCLGSVGQFVHQTVMALLSTHHPTAAMEIQDGWEWPLRIFGPDDADADSARRADRKCPILDQTRQLGDRS